MTQEKLEQLKARCCGLTPKIPAGRTVTDWC